MAIEGAKLSSWDLVTRPLIQRYSEFQGIGFNPWVTGDQLDDVRELGKTVTPSFQLRQLIPNGPPQPLVPRARHAPLVFLTVEELDSSPLGIDLLTEPTRSALFMAAASSLSPKISAPVELSNQTYEGSSLLVAVPIVNGEQITGFITTAISSNGFLDALVGQSLMTPGRLEVRDIGTDGLAVFVSSTDAGPTRFSDRINVYGRTWEINAAVPAVVGSPWPWVLVVLTALLVTNLVWLSVRRHSELVKVEQEVRSATASLVMANHDLDLRTQNLSLANQTLNRKNRELESFAYVASHDLRGPLRGIKNIASWLTEDLSELDLPQSVRDYIWRLSALVQKMEGLIDGLVQYSRSTKAGGSVTYVRLTPLIEELISELPTQHERAVFHVENLPEIVTEVGGLSQVLTVLLDNAIFHNSDYRPEVWVDARLEGEWVEIIVSDNGPGIRKDAEARVFEIFQTLSPDSDQVRGLGLPIARKLVSEKGGDLKLVENKVSHGAAFFMTWPIKKELTTEMETVEHECTT